MCIIEFLPRKNIFGKSEIFEKNILTKGYGCGILTELRKRGCKKQIEKERKKCLTTMCACSIINLFRVAGRVPCKLNNERNEKHQTERRNARRSLREYRVKSITGKA